MSDDKIDHISAIEQSISDITKAGTTGSSSNSIAERIALEKQERSLLVEAVMELLHNDKTTSRLMGKGTKESVIVKLGIEKIVQQMPLDQNAYNENKKRLFQYAAHQLGREYDNGVEGKETFLENFFPKNAVQAKAVIEGIEKNEKIRAEKSTNQKRIKRDSRSAPGKTSMSEEDRIFENQKRYHIWAEGRNEERNKKAISRGMGKIENMVSVAGLALGFLGMVSTFNKIEQKDEQGKTHTNWEAAAIFGASALITAASGLALYANHGRGR